MLVVSDTSVLLNLCRVSAAGLLPELFREVWIPPAVAEEFSRLAGSRPRFHGLALPDWVRIAPPIQVAAEVRACPDLDLGETEALSLALELHADAVLMDEAAGRRAASVLKVPFVGVAGISSSRPGAGTHFGGGSGAGAAAGGGGILVASGI